MTAPILPMLAVRGEPFDSDEYVFEVKWNGIRTLAARESGGWEMWGRESADYRPRYPEMAVLATLAPGTILDGKLVIMSQGVPDLDAILGRHHLINPSKILHTSKQHPVSYMVFDLFLGVDRTYHPNGQRHHSCRACHGARQKSFVDGLAREIIAAERTALAGEGRAMLPRGQSAELGLRTEAPVAVSSLPHRLVLEVRKPCRCTVRPGQTKRPRW